MFMAATVAVALEPAAVWPEGMQLTLRAVARDEDLAPLRALAPGIYEEVGRPWPPPELLRLGVEYPDGLRATNLYPTHDANQPDVVLQMRSAEGGSGGFRETFWISPLPRTDGQFAVVCEWPHYDVPESRVDLNAARIRAAAGRARALWSPDAG